MDLVKLFVVFLAWSSLMGASRSLAELDRGKRVRLKAISCACWPSLLVLGAGQQDAALPSECVQHTNCSVCIQSPGCFWCAQPLSRECKGRRTAGR